MPKGVSRLSLKASDCTSDGPVLAAQCRICWYVRTHRLQACKENGVITNRKTHSVVNYDMDSAVNTEINTQHPGAQKLFFLHKERSGSRQPEVGTASRSLTPASRRTWTHRGAHHNPLQYPFGPGSKPITYIASLKNRKKIHVLKNYTHTHSGFPLGWL